METYKIYYTTAPESYDGFGTETLENTGYYDQRGKEVRKVKIYDKNNNWQTMRYKSGMHGVFDQNDFDALMSMEYPTFTRKDEPKKEEIKEQQKPTIMEKQEIQNPTIVNNKYIPQSENCNSVETVTPESMRYDMLKAIETIDRRVNGVDEYVAEKLGYIVGSASAEEKKKGIKYLCDAFSSEQVDAIAVAIYNIESKGQGCIIGDQTGIGKGRIAGAMIRYGMKRGLKPIFITERVNLFSDIFRDLIAIGSDDDIPYKILVGTELIEKKSIKKSKDESSDLDGSEITDEQTDDEEDVEFIEKEIYEKNKNYPNKFVYVKTNEDGVEETITRERKVSAVPFILNAEDPKTDTKVDIKDEDGHILYSADAKLIASVLGSKKNTDEVIGTTPKGNPKYKKVFVEGTMQVPNGFDFVLATYSQFNGGKNSPRGQFLYKIAQNNIVIMDESHNASGQSKVGIFLKEVLEQTLGVTFLSATFSKRPDNMPIYASKTSMADANMKDEELVNAIIKGGVALQEIVSSALVSEGQMIRRERSFEGIEVNYKYLDATQREIGKDDLDLQELHSAIMDRATEIIRNIIQFQKNYVDIIIAQMDKQIKESQGQIKKQKGTEEAGIKNTPAFNGIFNLINQLLFSLKAEAVGKVAVERLKEGKKPVISFANTMESFLNELRNDDGEFVKEGDVINSDFSMIFEKRLKNTLKYVKIEPNGEETVEYLNVDDMDEKFQLEYKYILSKINSTAVGICSSPIDVVIDVIKKAGFSVSEVTGRTRQLKVLGNDKGQIKAKIKESPNDAFRKFNNNEVDVLMINQAGSTGASAHAIPTKKVSKDQVKQRVMIFLQSELNVNTEVQKRGRINRTGQILKPIYDYVVSSVPAEKRLMMMLQRKLKSLSANTTSSQKQQGNEEESENDKRNVDFLNKYGDKIILEFLIENPLINMAIDDPLKITNAENPEKIDYTDASQKVSGRIAILSIKDQNFFYTEIIERYIAYINYLKQTDEYDLEVKDLDLKAETISKSISVVGKGGNSVFARNTILEECMVNNLRKPYKSDEIKILLENSLNGLTSEQVTANLKLSFTNFIDAKLSNEIRDLQKYFEDVIKNVPKSKAILKITDIETQKEAIVSKEQDVRKELALSIENITKITNNKKSNILNMFDYFQVGKPIYFPSTTYAVDREKIKGIFIGFSISETDKNPYAPSSMKLKFALESSLRFVSVPASKFDTLSLIKELTNDNLGYWYKTEDLLENWDNEIKEKSEDRTKRYIVTGNILQGFGKPNLVGNLISFTTINGGVKKGILLPESFTKGLGSSEASSIKVPIIKALPLILNLADNSSIETNGNLIIKRNKTTYYDREKYYFIEVPKTAKLGSKYFTDSTLIELSRNGTFNSSGQKMICIINYDKITETVQYLQDRFNLAVDLRPYQFNQIEDTIDIEEDYDDEVKIESDEFLNKLNEANRQEEERRRLEEERLAEEERLLKEKQEQESNNAKLLIEKRKSEVRSKFNRLINMINNSSMEMEKGGNLTTEEENRLNELNQKMNAYFEGKGQFSSKEMVEQAKLKHKKKLAENSLYREQLDWESKVERRGEFAKGGYVLYDDEGNKINLKVGDVVVEYKSRTPNQPKELHKTKGKIIRIVDAMANVSFEPNGYEEWIPLKDLKKVETNKKAKGGKVEKVMKEFKQGKLHSGSKKGPIVTNPKQAIAIALSEERASKLEKGGILKHKHSDSWGETITIRLIEPTSKGWKVEQTTIKGKSSPKTKIAYFKQSEINELFE